MRPALPLITLIGGLATTGCSAFRMSPTDLTPDLPTAPSEYQAFAVTQAAPMENWLEQFNDDRLSALVYEALDANPTIAERLAALEAARYSARSVYGRTLPNVSVGGDVSVSTVGTDNFDDPNTSFGLDGFASWEIDLWGRLRASVDASNLEAIASEADLAATELSIAAQTALAWFDLKQAVAQLGLARQTLEVRERTLRLTERRLADGLSSALDVRTARSNVFQAQSTIASRELSVGNAARALEVLLGRYPAAEIMTDEPLPDIGVMPSGGDPMLLLSRRPDIAASEARVRAAGLRADAARLAMRPSLDLSGALGLSGEDAGDLFDFDQLLTRVAGSVAQPLFNGGALQADADAALARARQALAGYTRTVLGAWQEVENAIQADRLLAAQEEAQRLSLEEAIFAEAIAERQYREGLTTIFNLIQAQNLRLNAESALITIRAARASNRVRYHLALGGGVPVSNPEAAGDTGGSIEP